MCCGRRGEKKIIKGKKRKSGGAKVLESVLESLVSFSASKLLRSNESRQQLLRA